MKFSTILALVASTQAVQLKTKSSNKHPDDVTVSIDGAAMGEIMGKLEDIHNSIGELMSNPAFGEALGPLMPELEQAAGQLMSNQSVQDDVMEV